MGREKKLIKAIKSFEKQIREHEQKIELYNGKDFTLPKYWKKEIEMRKRQKEEKLKKLKRK